MSFECRRWLIASGVVLCATVFPSARAEGWSDEASTADEPATVADVDDPWLRPGQVVEWTGDLDAMIERGFVRVLTAPDRTHYFVDGARERGIVAESAAALEARLNQGRRARDSVDVVVIPVRRDQLIPWLVAGRGDMVMGNLTVTAERRERVDFSPPFVRDVSELVVLGPDAEPVPTVEALSGRQVWVRRSSSYFESLQSLNQRFAAEARPPVDVRVADENLADEGLLEMVNAGLYPATVVDSHKLEWVWSKVFDRVKVTDVAIRDKGEVGVAYRKGSPQLAVLLESFWKEARVGTTFGNVLVNRYFKNSRWITDPTSSSDRRRFDEVVEIFRRYAEQYEFDYLMMVALGYQESRLDQGAKSHVGAVGIMQLMPETAAGSPVFMPDVSTPEANIHAGVKYLRHIVDRYFDDPEIDEVNRHLFAFAAYNAGPNRIARLRRTAPEYGLDPNRWFRNVQYVVASKVSQEPVRYVSNIYKYYLAYRRLRELEGARAAEVTN